MSDLSWLNPTPHAIAVYASRPLSPVATQHSLPSGRYSLLGPDFHRLDRASFAWRTHSITSSARASSVGGTAMPSALAVFILMISSKRVGCSTGRSAGRAPLRILSTYTAALRNRSTYFGEYDISPPSSANQRGTETAGTRCFRASSAARLLGRLG